MHKSVGPPHSESTVQIPPLGAHSIVRIRVGVSIRVGIRVGVRIRVGVSIRIGVSICVGMRRRRHPRRRPLRIGVSIGIGVSICIGIRVGVSIRVGIASTSSTIPSRFPHRPLCCNRAQTQRTNIKAVMVLIVPPESPPANS